MKKFLLVSVCSIILFGTAVQALRFETPAVFDTGMRKLTKFLPVYNEALYKALDVHNLMTELPGLKVIAAQQGKLKKVAGVMRQHQEALQKCNEQRFKRFKNPKEVLAKVQEAYNKETQKLKEAEPYDENSAIPASVISQSKLYLRKKKIEKDLFTDALTNGKKWGGQAVSKQPEPLPENLDKDIYGTGLEELAMTGMSVNNAQVALMESDKAFKEMQLDFVQKLNAVGVSIPDFDATKTSDIQRAREELKRVKKEYLDEAKAYIVKLDEQDAKYPEAVARREARSKNKASVIKSVQKQFPGEFDEIPQFDQKTPQDRQRMLISAMEKDEEGKIYLTETNALEIDQKIAEMKSTENLIGTFEQKADEVIENMESQYSDAAEFDFSQCSG